MWPIHPEASAIGRIAEGVFDDEGPEPLGASTSPVVSSVILGSPPPGLGTPESAGRGATDVAPRESTLRPLPRQSAARHADFLGYDPGSDYTVLGQAGEYWDFSHDGLALPDTIADLQAAVTRDPTLKLLSLNGYHDLATPFYSAYYTIDRMLLSPEARANITHLYFPSGHMIYHNRESAKKLAEAVEKFVAVTGPTTQP